MKNIFTPILLFVSINLFSQITSRTVNENYQKPAAAYDSLTNIDLVNTKGDYRQFIGQEILVLEKKGLSSNNRLTEHMQYMSFAKQPVKLSTTNTKEMYNPIKDGYITMSDPKAIEGKYFKILDVVEGTNENSSNKSTFIKLQRKDNSNIVYYNVGYNGYAEHISFLVVGYYEKLKQLYLNKNYVYTTNYTEPTIAKEINTNTDIVVKLNSEWTCSDVTLMKEKNSMTETAVLILKNDANQEIAAGTQKQFNAGVKLTDFTTKEDYLAKKQKEAELKAQKEEEARINAENERKRIEEQEKQRALQAQQAKIQDQKDAAAAVAAKEKRKQDLIAKYGQTTGALIAAGQVKIGMTAAMCIDAWGKPRDINRTTNTYGTTEQWVYNLKSYLYFKDGILTSIQN